MKSTLHKISPDYSKLIGVPYSKMNCWDLCREFYKIVFNSDLKYYYETFPQSQYEIQSLIVANNQDFHKVTKPKFGDLATVKILGIESHLVVVLDRGLMLHTTKKTGSVIDRIGRWHKMIVGYYSLNKDDE